MEIILKNLLPFFIKHLLGLRTVPTVPIIVCFESVWDPEEWVQLCVCVSMCVPCIVCVCVCVCVCVRVCVCVLPQLPSPAESDLCPFLPLPLPCNITHTVSVSMCTPSTILPKMQHSLISS